MPRGSGFRSPAPPGPRPAWYRRLPASLQRVAAASDRVPSVPLRAGPALRGAVAALPDVLATGREREVQSLAQRIADGICAALRVPTVRVRVALRRPPLRGGELQGLYTPGNGRSRDLITVWMLTAKRGQVVAFKTFLRTLLHELCHHLDYALLNLRDSLHTQGFYRRESSLFHALGAGEIRTQAIDSPAPKLYTRPKPEGVSVPGDPGASVPRHGDFLGQGPDRSV